MTSRCIKRVILRHYKSIASCNVALSDLSFLVGPNGSGKSNFIDALAFVRDGIRESLEYAIRQRGGINEVRRRSGGHPTHLGIRLDFACKEFSGRYAFEIGALPSAGFTVSEEQCEILAPGRRDFYRVAGGVVVECSVKPFPPVVKDRLYLVNAAGLPTFRPVFDLLSNMGFYNLNPKLIGDLQEPDEGTLLNKYGSNLASVIARLERDNPDYKKRIEAYLSRVAPSVHGFEFKAVGPKHSLQFRQDVQGQRSPWRFWAPSMSDGTLRALGVLTAIFQGGAGLPIRLVAIEEPEAALHPAAAGILLDSLREAAETTQVLATTHSADLLDREEITAENLLAVVNQNGTTYIGPIDEASRNALKQSLFTAGELLRLDQLSPDGRLFAPISTQPGLFGDDE